MNIYFYILIYIFDIEKCLFCKPERYKNPKTTNFAKVQQRHSLYASISQIYLVK